MNGLHINYSLLTRVYSRVLSVCVGFDLRLVRDEFIGESGDFSVDISDVGHERLSVVGR